MSEMCQCLRISCTLVLVRAKNMYNLRAPVANHFVKFQWRISLSGPEIPIFEGYSIKMFMITLAVFTMFLPTFTQCFLFLYSFFYTIRLFLYSKFVAFFYQFLHFFHFSSIRSVFYSSAHFYFFMHIFFFGHVYQQ